MSLDIQLSCGVRRNRGCLGYLELVSKKVSTIPGQRMEEKPLQLGLGMELRVLSKARTGIVLSLYLL